jgi:hypothetical protein
MWWKPLSGHQGQEGIGLRLERWHLAAAIEE